MKYFLRLLVLLLTILILNSCSNNQEPYQSDYYNESVKIEEEKVKKKCYSPSNPYNDWTGHYAWYERAEEKGRTCSWNSDSFIEWCEEYYIQISDYNKCLR